jgi:hypothetical protein
VTEKSAQGFFFCRKWRMTRPEISAWPFRTGRGNCEQSHGGFMKSNDPEVVQLELKYCERCGALWLRLRGTQEIYCAPCDLEMLDLPSPRRLPSKPRLPGNHKLEMRTRSEHRVVFGGKGGTA